MSLSSIPIDIRIQIWRLLLTRPCPVDIVHERRRLGDHLRNTCYVSYTVDHDDASCQYLECLQGRRHPDTGPFVNDRWICVGPRFSIKVLSVCRLTYKEAVDVLYRENKFILNVTNAEEIPVFDFSRIKSLHINAQSSKGEPHLQNYMEVMQKVNLGPECRLTLTTNFTRQDDPSKFTSAIQCLGPVESCTFSLAGATDAALLVAKLTNGQNNPPVFTLYNQLPKELRYHILSFTDLVQDYRIGSGRLVLVTTKCCRSCCETLFGCCCIQSSRTLPMTLRRSKVGNANFSETCRCKQDPLPLLQVSPEFQRDALQIMFAKSSFKFRGHTHETLNFLHKIEKHLNLLREIVLDVNYEDWRDWHDGKFQWDVFIDYIEAHLLLPMLSVKLLAGFAVYIDDPLLLSDVEIIRSFYRSLIPGLQRLCSKGLHRFSVHFSQAELRDWTTTYEQEVMGIEDIRST